MKAWGCSACLAVLVSFGGCQKAPVTPEVKVLAPVEVRELLPKASLAEVLGPAAEKAAGTRLDDCGGIRFEWPLAGRDDVNRLNRELVLASLSSGQPVRMLTNMGRVTLTRRADGLSLVEIRQALAARGREDGVVNAQVPHPVGIGISGSGLWCPDDRVLHFDTSRGSLSLAVELGGDEAADRDTACILAARIRSRAEDEFLGRENPDDESWLEPEH